MKLMVVAQTNSLSHLVKCLAVRRGLLGRGHQVVVAAGNRHRRFLQQEGVPFEYLPSLQDREGDGFPSIDWFMRPEDIRKVMIGEMELLRRIRPQRVLGVFRFTLKISSHAMEIPYDSLICGCMLPEIEEGLGFSPKEPGADRERDYMSLFFRYAGGRISRALEMLGLPPVDDARELLRGRRTFLWDFPEFMPLPAAPDRHHVGPLAWENWPEKTSAADLEHRLDRKRPLAVVSFGTCVSSLTVARRITSILADRGFQVVLAAGGQPKLLRNTDWGPRVLVCPFAPIPELLPRASLLVCHGGQMTLFDAIAHGVPTAVMPFQPEQAHNGVCLERLGCGRRLIPSTHFHGSSQAYLDALSGLNDGQIAETLESVMDSPAIRSALEDTRNVLLKYGGVDALLPRLLEEA